MRLVHVSLSALLFVACAADDLDFAGPPRDSGTSEPATIDRHFDDVVIDPTSVDDVVVVEDRTRRDTGLLCPIHSDACPPECAPFFGYRVFRVEGCFLPLQVISCVDRAYESVPGPSCVVRVDNLLFKTDEIRDGLDRDAWRQCEMSDVDFAIAWHAIPCDEGPPSASGP